MGQFGIFQKIWLMKWSPCKKQEATIAQLPVNLLAISYALHLRHWKPAGVAQGFSFQLCAIQRHYQVSPLSSKLALLETLEIPSPFKKTFIFRYGCSRAQQRLRMAFGFQSSSFRIIAQTSKTDESWKYPQPTACPPMPPPRCDWTPCPILLSRCTQQYLIWSMITSHSLTWTCPPTSLTDDLSFSVEWQWLPVPPFDLAVRFSVSSIQLATRYAGHNGTWKMTRAKWLMLQTPFRKGLSGFGL